MHRALKIAQTVEQICAASLRRYMERSDVICMEAAIQKLGEHIQEQQS